MPQRQQCRCCRRLSASVRMSQYRRPSLRYGDTCSFSLTKGNSAETEMHSRSNQQMDIQVILTILIRVNVEGADNGFSSCSDHSQDVLARQTRSMDERKAATSSPSNVTPPIVRTCLQPAAPSNTEQDSNTSISSSGFRNIITAGRSPISQEGSSSCASGSGRPG